MARTSYLTSPTKIKVVGLGGAGCNAITRMVREQIRGVEFIAIIQGEALNDIEELIVSELHHVPGIFRTVTCMGL
jgi:cell division GTPase FtsZ